MRNYSPTSTWRSQKTSDFKGWEGNKLREFRTTLLMCATSALTSTIPQQPRVHRIFVRNLFYRHKSISHLNTSFISFNYDIMLDKAMVPLQDDDRGDIEYGCYFRSFDVKYKNERRRWDPAELGKELYLLKPHGSFNWTWCPVCSFSRIYPEENVAFDALAGKIHCLRCKSVVEPVLIPPAWIRDYNNPNISAIWSIAEFLISQAEMLVFVGYSFSDADVERNFYLDAPYRKWRSHRPSLWSLSRKKRKVLQLEDTRNSLRMSHRTSKGSKSSQGSHGTLCIGGDSPLVWCPYPERGSDI